MKENENIQVVLSLEETSRIVDVLGDRITDHDYDPSVSHIQDIVRLMDKLNVPLAKARLEDKRKKLEEELRELEAGQR